jgi:alpha-glucosidase
LPHIASLGVDAVWISPFFTSPMKDFGYDVADYCGVDPMFGALADFDAVVESAHRLRLKVMIDLVMSHTSDQHPWFAESNQSRTNPRADWYVWAEPKPDGTAPNNWLSVFGGPAWRWDGRREQYYLHNFLATQPDLNLHNPAVQDALLDVMRFWLKRGVDGFRLDAINFCFADKELRDNPPLPPAERNDIAAPSVNPYNHQLHLYDKNQPENLLFLRRLRALIDSSGAVALGEIGESHRGLELLGEYTRGNELLHMSYAFEFLTSARLIASRIAEIFAQLDLVAVDGWACWAFSNHDVARHVSRWSLSPEAARNYLVLLMCLRGSVCIYQGEELSLPEAELEFEDLRDPYGIEFWPMFKGRDGCRTPMPWDPDAAHAGFSTARPWLPVPEAHLPLAVAAQEADPDAMLHHYRRALALRRSHAALRAGSQTPIAIAGETLSFIRTEANEMLFCAFNLSEHPQTVELPDGGWERIGADLGSVAAEGSHVALGPWEYCLAKKA